MDGRRVTAAAGLAAAPDAKTVVLRKLPKKKRFTVSVQVVTAGDGTLTGKRRYKACT
jgi:hypothetical protein